MVPKSSPSSVAAAAAAASVPTYKWMHVKRNVPKPGELVAKIYCLIFIELLSGYNALGSQCNRCNFNSNSLCEINGYTVLIPYVTSAIKQQ